MVRTRGDANAETTATGRGQISTMASEEAGVADDDPGKSLPPGYRYIPGRDIDILPPQGEFPLSRGAPERKLARVNRYDRRATLVDRQLVGQGTLALTFQATDAQPFHFLPGYFIAIQADDENLEKRRSPYCITSPPKVDRSFRLLIRVVNKCGLSSFLAALAVGDVINFRGPSGRSMVPKDDAADLVLLATGVGIGPFLSLCPHLLGQGFERSVTLYWGLRHLDDLCLIDELSALAATYGNFSFAVSLSQPPPGWDGLCGRLTESVPGLLDRLGGRRYYLVGNGAMIEELSTVLSDLGVDQRDFYQEAYFNIRHTSDPARLAEIRSRFVATDLFSPFVHLEAGRFMPESPLARRRGPRQT